jgi:hypothetical protein
VAVQWSVALLKCASGPLTNTGPRYGYETLFRFGSPHQLAAVFAMWHDERNRSSQSTDDLLVLLHHELVSWDPATLGQILIVLQSDEFQFGPTFHA